MLIMNVKSYKIIYKNIVHILNMFMKILVSDKGSSKFEHINLDNIISFQDTKTSLYLCKIIFVGGTHKFVMNDERNKQFIEYYQNLTRN